MSGDQTVAGMRRYLAEELGEFAAMEFDRMLAAARAEGAAEVVAKVGALRNGWDATWCGVTSPGLRHAVDDVDREWFDQTTQRKQGEANRAHDVSGDPDRDRILCALAAAEARAETLRRAAALMRRRTINAGISPWSAEGKRVVNREVYAKCGDERTAAHIASWHPAVAIAVADWLDSVAQAERGKSTVGERLNAIAVARAYLGGQP